MPSDDSIQNLTKHIFALLNNSEVAKLVSTDLSQLLKDPEDQNGITKIVGNYLDDKVTRFIISELFADTISLMANKGVGH